MRKKTSHKKEKEYGNLPPPEEIVKIITNTHPIPLPIPQSPPPCQNASKPRKKKDPKRSENPLHTPKITEKLKNNISKTFKYLPGGPNYQSIPPNTPKKQSRSPQQPFFPQHTHALSPQNQSVPGRKQLFRYTYMPTIKRPENFTKNRTEKKGVSGISNKTPQREKMNASFLKQKRPGLRPCQHILPLHKAGSISNQPPPSNKLKNTNLVKQGKDNDRERQENQKARPPPTFT